ncbi:D-alanyl-D-alanine carboxypeptidase [Vibrio sp. SCSIO 43135]|uniref:D-alanyl-D-alanine carboxypeptidase family protein n=1 Tax=Vibrio sp. SCSIO 43135 TaxID=2819096 RepID=UPI002074C7AF|nr:D-alanyl-D-alanine carboxypeptidase family protein [Vibrio sp. SCSIO 43135]USD43073.1 D-alanyl-D-alanine carboxypeptidase [Vibrio sp. SCSIO 43135]
MKRGLSASICLLLIMISLPSTAVITPNPPELSAKGYVLMDFNSGAVIAQQNARTELAPASLTKLMTAFVVGQEIRSGRLAWDDVVSVSKNAWSANFQGSSLMFIKPKDEITVRNLMTGLIVQSGNDAAVALAEHIAGSESAFVSLMNGWAQSLSLEDTRFINAHGLDGDGIKTSPLDMARLLTALIKELPEVYQLYGLKTFQWNDITQYNRNKLLWDRSIDVDGGKTGYTEAAGYSLVSSATEGSMRLISVVMGASSEQSRASASKALLNYGFRFFDTQQVMDEGQIEARVRVWKGQPENVGALVDQDAYLTLPRTVSSGLSKKVIVDKWITAPLAKGDLLGRVEWRNGGNIVATYPIVSAEDVTLSGWVGQVWDGIKLRFSKMLAWLSSQMGGGND